MQLIISVLIGIIVVLVLAVIGVSEVKKRAPKGFLGKYPKVLFLFIILPVLFLFSGLYVQVGPNEVGIIYDELGGGVLEETYDQGLHFKTPFRHVTTISTTNRTSYINVFSQTEDSIYAE